MTISTDARKTGVAVQDQDAATLASTGQQASYGFSVAGATATTSVTAAGSTNTKGSYTQIVDICPFDTAGVFVQLRHNSADARLSLDLAIGGAGQESVVIPDLWHERASFMSNIYLPWRILKGQRVAARCQSQTANTVTKLGLVLVAGRPYIPRGLDRAQSYGFTAASTQGVLFDAGAVANTVSAWQDICVSATDPIKFMYPQLFRNGTPGASVDLVVYWGLWNGSSYDLMFYEHIRNSNASYPVPNLSGPYPVNLPAGSRIGAAVQSSGTDAGGRTLAVGLITMG